MPNRDILEQRRLARQEKSAKDAELMRLHRRIADTMQDATEARKIRERALLQVDKWEKGALCSENYISAWRAILRLPLTALRETILRNDAEGVALRQNTPFGFLKARLQ
jgi:hypothetical protein